MCGRYSLTTPVDAARQVFGFANTPNLQPHWNIAPTMAAAVVRRNPDGGARDLSLLRWGLVPHWARDASGAARMINARADTVEDKPAFRAAFAKRRCLVPADGFYEWTIIQPGDSGHEMARPGAKQPGKQSGKQSGKQPWRITTLDERPFAFAGLWEGWKAPDQTWLKTFTIITTDAATSIAHIHARMPVMLEPDDFARWLDPETPLSDLKAMLRPAAPERLRAYKVGTMVNAVKNDGPACFEPLAA